MSIELITWLQREMTQHGWDIATLARHSGLSAETIRHLLREPGRKVKRVTCTKLAEALHADVLDICRMAGVQQPPRYSAMLATMVGDRK